MSGKLIRIGPLEVMVNIFWRRGAKSRWIADRMRGRQA